MLWDTQSADGKGRLFPTMIPEQLALVLAIHHTRKNKLVQETCII